MLGGLDYHSIAAVVRRSLNALLGSSATDGSTAFKNLSVTGGAQWLSTPFAGAKVINGKIARSVSGSALTIALKTLADADPSDADPVYVLMPTVTGAVFDGGYSLRKITTALSLVISSGSTLGHTSAIACPVYVYLGDNAGALVLGASTKFFGGASIQSSTAEGGAGAADVATTLYSTAAQANIAWVTLQRWKSTQATAGTWAAATGEVQLYPFPYKAPKTTKVTVTGTFTRDWDTLVVDIYVKGGGASGAVHNVANAIRGGGGGEGEEAWRTRLASEIAATETVTIGAGGVSVTPGTGAGGNVGGTTSFGAHVTAVGGAGGTPGGSGGAGGLGGTGGTGADFSFPGSPGQAGADSLGSTVGINAIGGGKGGAAASAAAAANTGAGGGSGSNSAASGAGGSGVGVVKEHYSEGA